MTNEVRIPDRQASRYHGRYDAIDDAGALFTLLRDAIEEALTSGVRATAFAGYERALECHHRLEAMGLPGEIGAELRTYTEDLVRRFPTAWRVHVALAEVERAGDAARADVQREHLERALATLDEGMEDAGADPQELQVLAGQVREHIANLQVSDSALALKGDAGASLATVGDGSTGASLDAPAASSSDSPLGSSLGPLGRDLDRTQAAIEAAGDHGPSEGDGPAVVDVDGATSRDVHDLSIVLQVPPRVHLAMLGGASAPVHALSIRSDSPKAATDLTLEITSEPALVLPSTLRIDTLTAERPLDLGPRRAAAFLRHDLGVLQRLDETTEGSITARLLDAEGRELTRSTARWTLFPSDSWIGADVLPELLAAFVLPGDPAVESLLAGAAKHLDERTGSPAIEGYQANDPVRAVRIVEAAYRSLQDEEITYANPPASFERDGQRVRFPSVIRSSKLATCLDAALLAAAVIERAGLHPLVILVDGHALAGAWLVERTFPSAAVDESLRLTKRIELAEIVAFDATLVTSRPTPDFEAARARADEVLSDRAAFGVAIDVRRARLGGVLPIGTLSDRASGTGDGVSQRHADPSTNVRDLDADLQALLDAERRRREDDETPETRLDRWLRQLLDLTMRNRLLSSSKTSKRVLPLFGAALASIEDRLAEGKSLRVVERPKELDGLDASDAAERLAPLVDEGLRSGRLHSMLGASELEERLLQLYREARTAREEGGSNSLYLAIGFLSYRETPGSTKERRAPLILLPLELRRKSARRSYSLVHGPDEPRVNVTLLEYLRRDHSVDVLGVDPLPTDDKGVDVPLVLRVFKDAIKDQEGWEVIEEAQIGLYSFSKYLLWRDLKDRADVLRRNPLVEHLLERPSEPFPQEAEIPDVHTLDERFGVADLFAPMSYDSSQLAAILAAAEGRTMVLEGPPGTGKSQTITNLIAHGVAQGKTVLFVSEKMAALDVVHKRLRGLGLGTACLELHSNKAGKKAVLEQFAAALEEGRVRGQKRRAWEDIAGDVEAHRSKLNRHVHALHRSRESGESVHEVVARSATRTAERTAGLSSSSADEELVSGDPRAIDAAMLSRHRSVLDDIDVVAAQEAIDPDHPLRGVGRSDYSPLVEQETREQLRTFDAPAGEFRAAATEILQVLGLDGTVVPASEAGWSAVARLGHAAKMLDGTGDGIAEALTDDARLDRAGQVIERVAEERRLKREFGGEYRAPLTSLDLDQLEGLRREAVGGGWFTRWRKTGELLKALRGIAKDPKLVEKSDVIPTLDAALRLREIGSELDGANPSEALRFLGDAARGDEWDTTEAKARLDLVRMLGAVIGEVSEQSSVTRGDLAAALVASRRRPESEDAAIALDAASERYSGAIRGLREAALPDDSIALGWAPDGVESLRSKVRTWRDAWGRLRGWCRWQRLCADANDAGLTHVAEAVEAGTLQAGCVRAAYDASFDRAWALHAISADEDLRAFERQEHERSLDRYRDLDEERLVAAREEARQRVAAKRPQPSVIEDAKSVGPRTKAAQTGLGLLQRELTKKTRHVAIRRLLNELGEIAMELKPCFLMSPMSVAQYLDAEHPPFDLVVFDEASQIPVWDAIGAIARGRQAVIVGDPKQLPPTSFFSRGEDDAVAEDDIQDLESILDECIAARVPTHRLTWHYRSRHESLIAFSNARYYDSRLLTFPSGSSDGLGVSVRHLEDGVYDKGKTRTNRVEAEAVVAEVLTRLEAGHSAKSEPMRSIGVVTFSQPQQTLILDLFDAALRDRPHLEPYFDEADPESVFVKNLENVQGDERDVILFSIGYGPDERGRVSMNFGPLNKEGGERRLNVAVTRARQEAVVFTSLRSDQIDLARTNARGVRDLRGFLRHAESTDRVMRGADDESAGREASDALCAAIAAALESRGWNVARDVGNSDIRLDLAVRDPERAGEYLIGVVTDGVQYARSATARDRDRLRPDVLSGLGWQLERVWAVDWWRDAAAETERLHAAIEAALAERRA